MGAGAEDAASRRIVFGKAPRREASVQGNRKTQLSQLTYEKVQARE